MTTKQPGDLASTREECHNESFHHQHQHGDPGRALHLPLRKKQLQRQAALPWNADDLPRFDEDFLAAQKARYQQAGDMGMMP